MRHKFYAVFLSMLLIAVFTGCAKKAETAKEETKAESAKTAQEGTPDEYAPTPLSSPITEEKVLFGFEKGNDGFEIPSWAEEKTDNAGKSLSISKSFASEGKQSVCLTADFPGKIWTSALIELEQYMDFSQYRQISADIYLPDSAPLGLKAKIVLTVGEDWTWTEMVRTVPLVPGQWVTVSASLENGSLDWKRAEVTDAFKADVRKVVIRVESNKRPTYSGPIYIDNLRVGK